MQANVIHIWHGYFEAIYGNSGNEEVEKMTFYKSSIGFDSVVEMVMGSCWSFDL